MTYAMICNNRVIEVLTNQKVEPQWPPDPEGNSVIAITCNDAVQKGMVYDPTTGVFSDYVEPEPIIPEPTQLDTIEESQLIIMEALAEQYELNEERYIDDLEIKAEIYEAILEMGGNV